MDGHFLTQGANMNMFMVMHYVLVKISLKLLACEL